MTGSIPPDGTTPDLSDADWLKDAVLGRVFEALTREGGEARIAGGAVRNALLREDVSDIDIATTEPPDRVMALASRAGFGVHPVGLEHGTVLLSAPGADPPRTFEVTTLRVDVETFGRHARVAFTDDWEADARRRDFTINALYCDRTGRVFDPVGGYPDILARRVRFVGDPEARIREDYLRILRFFRFHARYGEGAPDAAGLAACVALQAGLERLSAERIRAEFLKLLLAHGAAATLVIMRDTGILARILPFPADTVRFARMAAIDGARGLEPDPMLRLAALSPPGTRDVERMRLTNSERARLKGLAEATPPSPRLREPERRIVLHHLGRQAFADAVRLAWAGEAGATDPTAWLDLLALADRWTPPPFPVTGADLLARGLEPGPEVGRTLRMLEDWWIASGFTADKSALLARLGR